MDESMGIPSSNAPDWTWYDGTATDNKNLHQVLNLGDLDKDDVPDLTQIDEDNDDDWDPDHEQIVSTAAAAVYTVFTETNSNTDPKTLKEAMSSSEWPKWEKAIQIELEMLRRMGTWELVDPPENRKPITNKWVFIRKYNKDGILQKYEACLVARGFSQIPGMDHTEML